ncbi:MAG: universal stress protein [Thermoleophilia bacterium]|nr:universal stress protein [Thermoleophilia bacterium]
MVERVEICPIENLETILLCTDGSEYSQGAVREAISLAGKCSSRLMVMTAIEVNPEYAAAAPQLAEKEEVRAREIVDAVKGAAASAGVDCETEVRMGEAPWRIIVEEAKKHRAELIVMGRRGRTGLVRVAMGSVTARVIGHAACDVLVVPKDAGVDYRIIMAATDGSSYGETAVAEALKMAAKCGGRLIIISVAASDSNIEDAEKSVAGGASMAAAAGIEAETMTASGKAHRRIVAAAEEKNADLIVIGCHGRTGLASLLMGSVTEQVIGHARCAVLVACAAIR